MMKTLKFISFALLFGAFILIDSCNADKLELTNPNELSPETYFKTPSQVQAAVNAAYGNLQTRGLYNRHIWFGYDNMAHENCGNPQLEADKREYLNFSFDPTHGAIRAFWESCYIGINKANFVIDNREAIDQIPDEQLSKEMKAKFDGEAKFMRALFYFMLVDRFGDVPLVLEVPEDQEGLPRTPKAEVWAQIEQDLQDAANQCLPKSEEDLGRATSGAAWALLGKARLFQGNYQGALDAFEKVTGYSLEASYFDNFMEETEHGPEQVFSVEFNLSAGNSSRWNSDVTDVGLNETCFRGQEYGCFNWYNVFPSVDLRNEFETAAENGVKDDPRYSYCFYENGDLFNNGQDTAVITPLEQSDGSSYPRVGWRKYQNYYKQVTEIGEASGINMKIIRYADVLLMMAECEANLGNLGPAVDLMNEVRARPDVDMPLYGSAEMDAIYPVSNLAEFMVALEHERKVELCGEQVRFPDLVRWGRLEAFMDEVYDDLPLQEQQELVFQVPKNLLWPIPQAEINANISLTNSDQNPGY
jgi:tetratricopeptide (TPR) repeat protein